MTRNPAQQAVAPELRAAGIADVFAYLKSLWAHRETSGSTPTENPRRGEQSGHGPVACRNIRIKPLTAKQRAE